MRFWAGVISVVLLAVLLAPLLAPIDPRKTDAEVQLQPPDPEHWLGTDLLGRDVWSRALHGGRRTLLLAALASLIGVVPGAALGLVAGLFGGRTERAIVTLINGLLAFPALVLALVVLTLLGGGLLPLALATGLAEVAGYARITRSAVIAVRAMTYVDSAYALGAPRHHIALNHILPNAGPTMLAYAGVVFSYSILNSAALSFLGLGGAPGTPDWGTMLADARLVFLTAPWLGIAPGLGISLVVLAANRLADGYTARHLRHS